MTPATPIPFVRNFLFVAGLVFVATGLVFLVSPGLVVAVREAGTPSADAINDVRAIYGGLEAGLGAFFLYAAFRPSSYEAGAVLAIAVGGVAALSRFAGFALVSGTPAAHLGYGALDLVGVVFGVLAMRRVAAGRSNAS
ncbi:MAG: DUF4345 family protein [Polyangiales bacterium]